MTPPLKCAATERTSRPPPQTMNLDVPAALLPADSIMRQETCIVCESAAIGCKLVHHRPWWFLLGRVLPVFVFQEWWASGQDRGLWAVHACRLVNVRTSHPRRNALWDPPLCLLGLYCLSVMFSCQTAHTSGRNLALEQGHVNNECADGGVQDMVCHRSVHARPVA